MNYIKLQKKILDNWLKNKINFNSQETNDSYIVTDNSHQVFIIPKDEFYLDMKKLMGDKTEVKFDKMMKIDGEDGHLTGEMKMIGKDTTVKVASENNYAWIDKALLDRYEIKWDLHFTVSGQKNPLLVWEADELRGVILPVYVKDDE